MQDQTLSSEAHWDIFQECSSTGCCPPAHIHTHGLQPRTWCPCLTLLATPPAWFGSLYSIQARTGGRTEGCYTSWESDWIEMTLLVGTMTFNRKEQQGTKKHQDRQALTHSMATWNRLLQQWVWGSLSEVPKKATEGIRLEIVQREPV